MGTPKIQPTEVVGNAVNGIKKLKGNSRKIDDKLEYWRLGELLNNIRNGKYGTDKDVIAKNSNYVMGLQIEYRAKYGDPGPEPEFNGYGSSGMTEPVKSDTKKSDATKSETNKKPVKNCTENENKNNVENDTPPAPKKGEGTDKAPEKPVRKNPFEGKKPQEEDKKPSKAEEQKPTKRTTKSSFNENSNNNGLIINGNNNTIFTGAIGSQKSDRPESPEEITKEQKEQDIIKASKENYSAALASGKQVAKDLIGSTNQDEKANVIRTIMQQSKETIMGFIEGFNQEDNISIFGMKVPYGQGGLLDQIDNEGSWFGINDAKWTKTEKNDVFEKIISTVLEWASDMGFESDGNYINLQEKLKSLQKGEDIKTEQTDKLINELISKGKLKTGV